MTWAGLSVSTNEQWEIMLYNKWPTKWQNLTVHVSISWLGLFLLIKLYVECKISHFKIQPFFVFIGNFRCKYFWIKYSNILFSGLYFWSFRVSLLPQQVSSLWQFCENKVKWKKVLEDNFSKKFNDFMIKSSSLPLEHNIKSSEPSCSLGF